MLLVKNYQNQQMYYGAIFKKWQLFMDLGVHTIYIPILVGLRQSKNSTPANF